MKKIVTTLVLCLSTYLGFAQYIYTIAGGGSCSGANCGDGGPATSALLNIPNGIVHNRKISFE